MTLQKKARYFIAATAITLIIIGMACAFILVDLNSERYMPGMLAPIYRIDELGAQGIGFYWMGVAYRIEIAQVKEVQARIWEFRAFIPPPIRLVGSLVAAFA